MKIYIDSVHSYEIKTRLNNMIKAWSKEWNLKEFLKKSKDIKIWFAWHNNKIIGYHVVNGPYTLDLGLKKEYHGLGITQHLIDRSKK